MNLLKTFLVILGPVILLLVMGYGMTAWTDSFAASDCVTESQELKAATADNLFR